MSTSTHDIDVDAMGQRAFHRRKSLGWDQAEVADRSTMSREYVSGLETGRNRNPKIKDLAKVANGLQVSLGWLLWGDGPTLSDEEEADLARLEPQFKNIMFASGRRYRKLGTAEARAEYLAALKFLAGEEYRESLDPDA